VPGEPRPRHRRNRHDHGDGTAAALVFGPVFFPSLDAVAGTAAALATVGVAPLVRPAAAFLPELFATRYRYTGAGVAFNLAAILGGVVPAVLAAALQARFGGLAVGVLPAGLGLLGLCCTLALPETRDRRWTA
jgi:hypothetical protein